MSRCVPGARCSVLPASIHGGPGRAGGGEELGGLRGLAFYQQRTALQGFKSHVAAYGPAEASPVGGAKA